MNPQDWTCSEEPTAEERMPPPPPDADLHGSTLQLNETIDKVRHEQFKKERGYWKQVIFRIIALVKFLAKHNLAFHGSKERLYQKAQKIKEEIIKKIKEAKYYSIILDCTPDTSHQEQMSMIVRYLNFSGNSIIVEESFLGFLNVNDTTGKGLFDVTIEELKSLGLEIDDIRGQGYDNGANMKGKQQRVQKRFLDVNPRAFYIPCGCHSLNLTLSTVNLSRPNVARVCVEVNLSKELPKAIWIHLGSSSYLQPLLFENLPSYCNSCHQLGHKSCKSGTRNSRWVRKTKPRGKAVAPGQPDIGPCPTMSKNGPPPRLDSTALAPTTDANLTLNGPPLTGLDSTPLSLPTDANLDASYLECAQHQDTKDRPLLIGPCELAFTKEGPSYPVEQDLSPQILPQSQNDGYDPNHTDENMRAHETHRESSDGTPSDTMVPPIGNDDALSDPSTHTKVHAGKDDEAGKDALSEAEPVSPHTQEEDTNISFEPRSFCRYIKVIEERSMLAMCAAIVPWRRLCGPSHNRMSWALVC
ncbi:unnamed protein product [Cuscuta campestris]|uniref:DUF4371 domain-containing protein n=1 Tax=Cuscuta campestris TaxID=132261 RepID=A0A484MMV3_9ASTE|nr:unnamed protein product [Cuscuta campestris]